MFEAIGKNFNAWKPDRPVSSGAAAYHEAVVRSSWMEDVVSILVSALGSKIRDGDLVVDFGAGTGASAQLLLKHLKQKINLCLVDNSKSWLGKSYEILNDIPNVEFFALEKKDGRYATLAETVGNGIIDHVISTNTIHLIPDLKDAFIGISNALKKDGTFTFQTGNFTRKDRSEGALMIDDTVNDVHDMALETVRVDPRFESYREDLDKNIETQGIQRKFVFPDPKPIEFYLKVLKESGFEHQAPLFTPVRIMYDDWLNFLRVKRLQAGILPEIGGKESSPKAEQDRDTLITESALKLFKNLKANNPLANDEGFIIDCVHVLSRKI